MQIREYVKLARERTGLPSNHQLALRLGLSNAMMTFYMSGKSTPSQEVTFKIAHLAGIPEHVAAVDWASWNDKANRKRAFWLKLRAAAVALGLAILLAMMPSLRPSMSTAQAAQPQNSIHYATIVCCGGCISGAYSKQRLIICGGQPTLSKVHRNSAKLIILTMAYVSAFPRMMVEPDDRMIERIIAKTIIGQLAPPNPIIAKASRIASLGSCFAQEISKSLRARDLDVEYMFMEETWNSALALEAFLGWLINDEKLPSEFSITLGIENTQIKALKDRLATADLFIMTFGMSLCSFDQAGNLMISDKTAITPEHGTTGTGNKATMQVVADAKPAGMRQTTVAENEAAILRCIELVKKLSPKAAIVMTLSPVPLMGTKVDMPSVPANSISKSVLRVALEQVCARKLANVFYWPSYEIVTWYGGHVERAFGDDDRDARHVRQKVIDIIANLFLSHYLEQAA